jgi:hypothetical protein
LSLDRFKAIQVFCRSSIVMNETLEQVRFEFDLLRLAMKLNAGDSLAAQPRMADVDEIEATLENLHTTITRAYQYPLKSSAVSLTPNDSQMIQASS